MKQQQSEMGSNSPHEELFGPDPDRAPLAYYQPSEAGADMFASASPQTRAAWHTFAAGLARQCQPDLGAAQGDIDRHVSQLGIAFRVTGDERERAWPLNPMPILIGSDEWSGIEAGLVQRAELLERVIADIYGEQTLVSEGHLPAAVISGSSNFARRMVGLKPPGGHYIQVCAVDLVRGPDGEWRVLGDRIRLTSGIGYALENRLALARATGGLLASIGVRRQTGFFEALRQGIAASCERSDPRIGLLTPGHFNQSYPEQALLARHLGFSLVEGRDLAVHDDKLFVRTIAGLKRIDALWRWIGTRDIDPLNFDSRSQIGVPNLIAAAEEGLVLANWPGGGVVESRAMPAFLPRLAHHLLGEPLKLPNAATWWLGSEKERGHVLANLDNLIIGTAFRQPSAALPGGHTRVGSELSAADRAQLEADIAARPMDFAAQEIVRLSTTPALAGGRFEPRGFTVRAFLARDAQGGWSVLQGGFARISQTGNMRTSLMGLGDIATDLCVVDPEPADIAAVTSAPQAPPVRREQGLLPSQAADNLFWLGRYCERAHQTTRIIRTLTEQVTISGEGADTASAITRLANLLRQLGAVPAESRKWQPSRLAGEALGSTEYPGSVRNLLDKIRQLTLLLRDRVTRDSWRAMQRPMPAFQPGYLEGMAGACDRLVERFASLSQLMSEGLSRGPAWSFLEMGACTERASMVLQAAQATTFGNASAEDLSAFLDWMDGHMLYRSRYLSQPFLAPVLDMALLDPTQPRGFAYQVVRLVELLTPMPSLVEGGLLEEPLRRARQLRARLENLDAEELDKDVLDELLRDLGECAGALGDRYFLQKVGPLTKVRASLLA